MSRELLPSPLRRDANYQALSDLLDRFDLDLTKLLIYWLDDVDASALPTLAKQFHVMGLEGWDFATTEAQQRALLKQAVELHRLKGTTWAVRQGIKRYDPNLDIQEWFEYGGEPYRFRLVNGQAALTLHQAVELFHTIEALKSLRSKLEGGIEAEETIHQTLRLLSATLMSITMAPLVSHLGNAGTVIAVHPHIQCQIHPVASHPAPCVQMGRVRLAAITKIEVTL